MAEHMLTTIDNPWDPRESYEEWYAWDYKAGYHTPGLLARVADTSDELSDADQDMALEAAITMIVTEIGPGLYRKLPTGTKTLSKT